MWRHLRGFALLRCPRCFEGPIYEGLIRTRETCPVCGLRYERDPGYFTGAMYGSYILGIVLTFPVWLIMLMAGYEAIPILAAVAVELAVLLPILFRFSRSAWLHFDAYFNGTPARTDDRP